MKILRELLILQIGAAEDPVRGSDLRQADLDISLALRSFEALSPALKQAAVQDFGDIFRAQLFSGAATLRKTPAVPAQTKLLDRTCDFPDNERLVFLHFVRETGSNIRHCCVPSDDRPTYVRD